MLESKANIKPSLLRINIENSIKLVILFGIIIYLYPDLRDSFVIMFRNDASKAGDLLIAVSTLVVGSMFAYFSGSYAVVKRDSFLFRILVYIKTFALLFGIFLTLVLSSILFPIFLNGLGWLFKTLTYALMVACAIYDVINIQVIGKDWN